VKPDFPCVGGSGTFVFQTAESFRQLAFPAVKSVIELVPEAGSPTQVHSCGPEARLVKISAEETDLLEPLPMGDYDPAQLKPLYGHPVGDRATLARRGIPPVTLPSPGSRIGL